MPSLRTGITTAASVVVVPPFDPAAYVASALVDQNWVGLGGIPAGWVLDSGTPTYSADGLEAAASCVLSRDLTGLATNDFPGTLLVIYGYDDFTTMNADVRVGDTALDYEFGVTIDGDGTNLDIVAFRIEVPDAVNCIVDPSSIPDSASGIGYVGTFASADPGFTPYARGFSFTDDNEVWDLFSGNDCDPPGTAGFTAGSLDHMIVSITDSVPNNTKIRRTLYWDQILYADLVAVVTYLGWITP